ncbi:MAG: YiiX/YebB-like N1pC/P60 family cysteine hydrolase [Clostridiales bacterium]
MKKKIFVILVSITVILSNVGSLYAYNINLPVNKSDVNNLINKIIEKNISTSIKADKTLLEELTETIKFQSYIENNWDNLEVEKDPDLYNSTSKNVGKPGDILITAFDDDNYDLNAIKVGSLTTHAALVDSNPKKVLEVLPNGSISAEVKNADNDWRVRYKKILIVRPKTNIETINAAIKYGHTKIKTPFNFNIFDKTTNTKFYCSQFVWKCYLNSGLDLDRNDGKAVFPYDFISDKTTIVYKQGD